ncbi:hypothetical protein WAI453_006184 [Rhynchosporium graminicola]
MPLLGSKTSSNKIPVTIRNSPCEGTTCRSTRQWSTKPYNMNVFSFGTCFIFG